VAALLFQNFFFGMVFYNYLYSLPLFYQNVRKFSPIKSALMTLPMVLTQSVASILSGQYISRTKRYGEVIWLGYFLFTLGIALTTLFNRTIPQYGIILILIILGYGNGNCFQPTIIALQAHCFKSQRAVVISVRNFLRCLGGSIGLAISSAIQQNVLKAQLPEKFKYLSASTYAKPDYSKFSVEDGAAILDAYARASRMVFVFMAPCAGLCLLTCVFVRDRGLTRPEEAVKGASVKNDEEVKNLSTVTEKETLEQREMSVHSLDEKEEKDSSEKADLFNAEKSMEAGQLGVPPKTAHM
jgi:MFS family permease